MDSLDFAEAKVTSLAGMQKSQLQKHLARESMPSSKKEFDAPMRDFLMKVKHRSLDLKGINTHLDNIGYAQSVYDPEQVNKLFKNFEGVGFKNMSGLKSFRNAKDKFKHLIQKRVQSDKAYYRQFAPLSYSSEEQIVGAIPKLKAHAGFDAFVYDGVHYKQDFAVKGNLLELYNERELQARKDGTFGSIAVPLHRTQASDPFNDDNVVNGEFVGFKSRGVQAFGTIHTLGERKFSLPFTKFIAEEEWYAGGYNQSEMATVINRRRENYKGWISIDFSKFDSTIPRWLTLAAFDIVEEFFISVENYCLPLQKFDKELFEIVKKDFVHTLIISPNGDFIKSRHGIKSGSSFTQIIGTICNLLMVMTYLEKQGVEYALTAMGDDNLIFLKAIPSNELLLDMSDYFAKVFGVVMSAEKSTYGASDSDHPEFLSRVWTRSGCYRDPHLLVAKMICPERFRAYERLGYTPEEVVHQYIAEFPLGMARVIDAAKFDLIRSKSSYTASGVMFAVTGSQRVQQIISRTRGRTLDDIGTETLRSIAIPTKA